MLHRALQDGAVSLGNARQRHAAPGSLGDDPADWTRLDIEDPASVTTLDRALRAGVLKKASTGAGKPDSLTALNRPLGEDAPQTLARATLTELFAGLDWRLLERTLENEKSLTSEVWRTFLWMMAAALILEALLCMPSKRKPAAIADTPRGVAA